MTLSAAPALFLDFDGTLVEIVARPDLTSAAPELLAHLDALHRLLDGALAIVTGRPLADLDRIIAPLKLPAAGVHGIEHRQRGGETPVCAQREIPDDIRQAAISLAGSDSRILFEDKGASFSLHYREAPELEATLRERFIEICAPLKTSFSVQNGKMVLELRPDGIDKGSAINTFMAAPPFNGRIPVFIGDDVTDEDGFKVVNRMQGCTARVGQPGALTEAQYNLANVTEVHAWLTALSETTV